MALHLEMNTEDFVTYEQALALKKLGFCEKAIGKYVDCPNDPTLFNGMLYQSWNLFQDEILAPTLAQAQKWLLKKFGHYVYVDASASMHLKFYWCITFRNDTTKDIRWAFVDYNSPEEALSAGITECLKLLENE